MEPRLSVEGCCVGVPKTPPPHKGLLFHQEDWQAPAYSHTHGYNLFQGKDKRAAQQREGHVGRNPGAARLQLPEPLPGVTQGELSSHSREL